MDKKSLAILFVIGSFANSAFATGIVDKFITKHSAKTSSTKTYKTTKQSNHSYTDFSGTWTGNCGDRTIESMVIENEADYIYLDGSFSMIGHGLTGESQSNDMQTMSEHSSYEWNEDGSILTAKSVALAKSNTEDDSAIHTILSKFNFSMKKGQIDMNGEWTYFEDLKSLEQNTIHCVLTKKQ